MTQPSRPRPRTGTWIVITILLAASLVGTLSVPLYSRLTPALGGFPFFYWYQLIWVPIVAVLGGLAYALTRRGSSGSARHTSGPDSPRSPGAGTGGAA